MRKCLLILALTIVIHGPLYSARLKYYLPSSCLLSDGMQSFPADRLEIYAIQDEKGHAASPFQFVGYGKGGEIKFNLIYKSRHIEMRAPVLPSDSERDVIRREEVYDGFKIEDRYLRFSVNVVNGHCRAVVRDLDEDRVQVKDGSETDHARALLSTNWPHMDGEYVYRGSRGEVYPVLRLTGGENDPGGCLYLKGGLYQKGDEFLIRYVFTHEVAGGKCVVRAEGHAVGKFTEGLIQDCVITHDSGDDVFGVHVGLASALTNLPHYDKLLQELRKRGVENRAVGLRIDYGGRTFNLDFDVEVKSAAQTSSSRDKKRHAGCWNNEGLTMLNMSH